MVTAKVMYCALSVMYNNIMHRFISEFHTVREMHFWSELK